MRKRCWWRQRPTPRAGLKVSTWRGAKLRRQLFIAFGVVVGIAFLQRKQRATLPSN